jgi:hypothetical protein
MIFAWKICAVAAGIRTSFKNCGCNPGSLKRVHDRTRTTAAFSASSSREW